MSFMDTVKNHPYVTAGGVFVVGLILILIIFGGGSKAAPVTGTTSDTQGATELAMAQLQAQYQSHAADDAVLVSQNQGASAVAAVQAQASAQVNHDLMAYQAQRDTAFAERDAQIGTATLQANVLQSEIGANVQEAALEVNAQNFQTLANYNQNVQLINGQTQVQETQANLAAQTQQVGLQTQQLAIMQNAKMGKSTDLSKVQLPTTTLSGQSSQMFSLEPTGTSGS